MIKALMQGNDGRDIVVLGLSSENVARLYANEPIRVDLAEEPPQGVGIAGAPIIVLLAGSTEATIVDELVTQLVATGGSIEGHDLRPSS